MFLVLITPVSYMWAQPQQVTEGFLLTDLQFGPTFNLYTMNSDGTNVQPLTFNGIPLTAISASPSPNGRYIARLSITSSDSRTVEISILDRVTQEMISVDQFPYNAGQELSWSPDSQFIYYAAGNSTFTNIVRIRPDGKDRQQITNTLDRQQQAFDPAVSPDGTRIAYAENGGLVVVNSDGSNYQTLVTPPRRTSEWVARPAWSPDGNFISYITSESNLFVVNLASNSVMPIVNHSSSGVWIPRPNVLCYFALRDIGLATTLNNADFFCYDLTSGQVNPVSTFDASSVAIGTMLEYLPALASTNSVQEIPPTISETTTASIYPIIDPSNAGLLQQLSSINHNNYGANVRRPLSFQPGTLNLAFVDGYSVRVWDVITNQQISEISASTSVSSVAFNPITGHLAVAAQGVSRGITIPATVSLYNPLTGEQIASLDITDERYYKKYDEPIILAFAPNSGTLVIGAYGVMQVVDGSNLVPIGHVNQAGGLITKGIADLSFSQDGMRLGWAETTGYFGVTEMSTNSAVSFSLEGSALPAIAVSPDGHLAASGWEIRTPKYHFEIDIWQTDTGALQSSLLNTMPVSLTFSPDGRILAAGTGDGYVHLWDVSQGNLVATLPTMYVGVLGVTFSSDGSVLAAYSLNGVEGAVQSWVIPN